MIELAEGASRVCRRFSVSYSRVEIENMQQKIWLAGTVAEDVDRESSRTAGGATNSETASGI